MSDVCERPKCCDARARWLAATSGTFDACQMKATECHGGGPCWKLGYTSLRTALSAAEGREAALRGEITRLVAAVEHRRANAANIATLLRSVIDGYGPMLRLLPAAIAQSIGVCAKVAEIDAERNAPTPATEPRTP